MLAAHHAHAQAAVRVRADVLHHVARGQFRLLQPAVPQKAHAHISVHGKIQQPKAALHGQYLLHRADLLVHQQRRLLPLRRLVQGAGLPVPAVGRWVEQRGPLPSRVRPRRLRRGAAAQRQGQGQQQRQPGDKKAQMSPHNYPSFPFTFHGQSPSRLPRRQDSPTLVGPLAFFPPIPPRLSCFLCLGLFTQF